MCLYGQDLDEDTTPVEAGLTWVIGKAELCSVLFLLTLPGKERRENSQFIGAEGVRKHLKEGPPRRRVGMIVEGAPARRKISRHLFSVNPTLNVWRGLSYRGCEDIHVIW